ncbi:MAG: hypothetical protein KAV82_15305 [Phycisphaerae bacterium]|nr:hypothetical protein [Phycisphaerae bacterium]
MRITKLNLLGRSCLAAATLLAGGTLMGTCELRLRDAFVDSSKSLVLGTFGTALEGLQENLATGEETTDASAN